MCESSVYLEEGSDRSLVMSEAARILFSDDKVTLVSTLGETTELADVEIVDANLLKHEIILRRRKGR